MAAVDLDALLYAEAMRRRMVEQEECLLREGCRRMELSDRGTRGVEEEGVREVRRIATHTDAMLCAVVASAVGAQIARAILDSRMQIIMRRAQKERDAIISLYDRTTASISDDEAAYFARMLQWCDKRVVVIQKSVIARQWVERQALEHAHAPVVPEPDLDSAAATPPTGYSVRHNALRPAAQAPVLQKLRPRPASGKPMSRPAPKAHCIAPLLSTGALRVHGMSMDAREDRFSGRDVFAGGGRHGLFTTSPVAKGALAGFSRRLTSLHKERRESVAVPIATVCPVVTKSLPSRPTSASLPPYPRDSIAGIPADGCLPDNPTTDTITYTKMDISYRSMHRPSLRPQKHHYSYTAVS